jgi:carboxypeptidase T
VPASAPAGTTRLRVAMRYNAAPVPCGTFNYGEVEDYSVRLQ